MNFKVKDHMRFTIDEFPKNFNIMETKDSLDWSSARTTDESNFKASSSSSFDP